MAKSAAAAVAVALALSACTLGTSGAGLGPADGVVSPHKGGTLRLGTGDGIDGVLLDPQKSYNTAPWGLLRCCLARTLMSFRPSNNPADVRPRPDLATGPPHVSADGLTWTFELKRGIRYGPPLEDRTVEMGDVVRALERTADPSAEAAYPFYYSVIEGFDAYAAGEADSISGLEVRDDHTLVVHLTQPTGDLAERFALASTAPIPAGVTDGHDENYGSFLVSTGPYMIEGSEDLDFSRPPDRQLPLSGLIPTGALHLVRNPSWDPATDDLRTAHVDRIEIETAVPVDRNNRDTQALLMEWLDSGKVDLNFGFASELPESEARAYRADPERRDLLTEQPENAVLGIPLNVAVRPLDDLHVRRAFMLALDRERLRPMYERASGFTLIPQHHFVPDGLLRDLLRGYQPYPKLTGDEAAAREEMASSRYDRDGDGRCDPSLCRSIKTLAFRDDKRTIAAINEDLAPIGLKLVPNFRDLDFWDQINQPAAQHGAFMGAYGWFADYPNPSSFFKPLLSRAGSGFQSYDVAMVGATPKELEENGYDVRRVPSVDARIDRCMELIGQPQTECWAALDQYVMEELLAFVPIGVPANYLATGEGVRGLAIDPWSGGPAFERLWLDPSVPRETQSSPTPDTVPQPSTRCDGPDTKAATFWFDSADGSARLEGSTIGTGRKGIVLLNQLGGFGTTRENVFCSWWRYAHVLADEGFKVMMFSFRCFGLSSCPKDPTDLVDDSVGAVEELRRRGAESISIVGASFGGEIGLIASTHVKPPPQAVVSLSGGMKVPGFLLDASDHLERVRAPVLFATSKDEFDQAYRDTIEMHRLAGSKVKKLSLLPAEWGHGWDLLTAGFGNKEWSSFARTVTSFLKRHS